MESIAEHVVQLKVVSLCECSHMCVGCYTSMRARAHAAQGWALYEGLLLALLRFMEPYLRVADLSAAMRTMYTGTLRLLLVGGCCGGGSLAAGYIRDGWIHQRCITCAPHQCPAPCSLRSCPAACVCAAQAPTNL